MHQGTLLGAYLDEQGRKPAWLAKKLGITRQAVNSMKNRQTINGYRLLQLIHLFGDEFLDYMMAEISLEE